tara:strand:+ start:1455 stop:3794 length:2340 start_codon:yes stop_codon:yes gene_type:complete
MSEEKKEEVKLQETLNKLLKDQSVLTKDQISDLRSRNSLNQAHFEEKRTQETILLQLAAQKEAALTEAGTLQEKELAHMQKMAGLSDEELARLEDNVKWREELKEIQKERKELRIEEKKMSDEIESTVGGIATKMGIGNSHLTKGVLKYKQMAKNILTSKEGMASLGRSMQEAFSVGNLLGRIIENTIALAFAADKAAASFAKTTGTGRDFQRQMSLIQKESIEARVGLDKAAGGLVAVNQQLIGGAQMSKNLQREVGLQIATFDRLGIESSKVVAIMNDMQASMGLTAEESLDATKALSLSATQLGIGPAKMAEGFQKASSVLAVHGRKSIEVFKGLAVAARNAGTSVDTLLSIAGKFDTFSDAADSAGKLNSILGSTMSATEMLMMTEEDRIETLIKTVNGQGKAFKDMGRFEQKAIAQAAGINDMAEANRIFGMSLGAYKQQQKEAQRAADVQQKFADAIQATVPIQEKFAFMLQEMAANGEVVDQVVKLMHLGLEAFQWVVNLLSNDFAQMFLVVALGVKTFLALTPFGAILSGVFGTIGASIASLAGVAAPASGTISVSVTGMGGAMAAAVKPMLAFGLAALMIGGGVALAAGGISLLVNSLAPLTGGQLAVVAGGLVLIGVGIYGLAAGLTGLANPVSAAGMAILLGIGLAFTGIGLGISLAANGFEKMVNNISQVGSAAIGLNNLVNGVTQLAFALDSISGDREIKFKTTLQNLALITSGRAAGMTAASAGVKEFSANIENSVKNNIELVVRLDETDIRAYIEKVHHNIGDT